MSSDIDMNDQITRLSFELEVLQEHSDTRIRELERENSKLKVESRLIAAKVKDPAPRPAAPTESSDPVLRAEISQLQEALARKDAEIASKDAEIASKDAIIAKRHRVLSDTNRAMTSLRNTFHAMVEDMNRTGAAAAAEIGSPMEPKVEVTNNDRFSDPASSSPTKDVKGEGETKPKTPLFGATPSKIPADAATAPLGSVKPNYSQVLQAPKKGPVFSPGTLPYVPLQGGVFNPFKRHQAAQRDGSPVHETQKERADQPGREDRGREKGLTSHDYPPEDNYPLTLRPAANQKAMSANAKGKNPIGALGSTDQLAATSNLQIGQNIPGQTDKIVPSGVGPEVALHVAKTPGMMLDNKGTPWDAKMVEFNIRVRTEVPPEVMAAYDRGALFIPKVEKPANYNPWGSFMPKSVEPPAQEPETAEAGPSEAALEDDKAVPKSEQPALPDSHKSSSVPAQKLDTGDAGQSKAALKGDKVLPKPEQPAISRSNSRKRSADEDQPGTEAPVKRLRST